MSQQASLPPNWRWRDRPAEAGPAVVFDIDGVLSDAQSATALHRMGTTRLGCLLRCVR